MADKKTVAELFKEKASKKFSNKFDYSKFTYVNAKTKSTIICTMHGEFQQSPDKHLNSKFGCSTCSLKLKDRRDTSLYKKKGMAVEDYLDRVYKKYGDKFEIDTTNYVGITKGTIVLKCQLHGDFKCTPINILISGHGCPQCGNDSKIKRKTKDYDNFIQLANDAHGSVYAYPESNREIYVNRKTIVSIECEKHGTFNKKHRSI
jgi:hypothetical protein